MLLGLALSLTEHLDSDSGEKLFHSLGLGQCLTSHHTEQYKFLEYGSIKYKNHHYQCHLTKIDDRIYSQKKNLGRFSIATTFIIIIILQNSSVLQPVYLVVTQNYLAESLTKE